MMRRPLFSTHLVQMGDRLKRLAVLLSLTVMAGLLVCPSGAAEAPAGTAVFVDPQATAQTGANTATLASGDSLFMGQQVITGGAGQVQVIFSDDTHLVIGPGSALVIAQYLLRNDSTASKFVVNALGGTFRFITGNSPKNAYEIDTPSGTLGVRGTAFDFTVDPTSGSTNVLLYHGRVILCPTASQCIELSKACDVGIMHQSQEAADLGIDDQRRPPALAGFNYLASQRPLDKGFQLQGVTACQANNVAGAKSTGPATDQPVPPPPPPPPPPPNDSGHDNKGLGNGGDSSSEGPTETENPGRHLGWDKAGK